jgi:cystathionine beta-lyase
MSRSGGATTSGQCPGKDRHQRHQPGRCPGRPPTVSFRQASDDTVAAVEELLGNCDLDRLRRRRSFKWTTFPPDVLPAFVAEMDFDVAEPVKAAIGAAISLDDLGYANAIGLAEAYSGFAAERFGWGPDPARVVAIPDVMTGIAEVVLALCPPGSGVAVTPPVYPPFFFRLGYVGRRVVEAPLLVDGGRYELDLEAIGRALASDEVGCLLLCNPHNPLGRQWSAADLAGVADLCGRHGAVLLVDEIHAPLELPYEDRHVPFLSLGHEVNKRTITFSSASKGWNVPGLKCGLAVAGSTELAAMLTERWEALIPSHLGVLAGTAAFSEGTPWLERAIAQIDENRHLLARLLDEQLPEVGYSPPAASFLAWLDCRALGLGDDPARRFLEAGRVALSPGPDFGEQGKGFARMNIGTSPELLAEAVRRMAVAVRPG